MDRNFWLGDGFASGGQYGYDHKKVGITAKGAWECTKLHFKSIQKDPEKDPLQVVAIGDMGGDVFGNGMLLSRSIHLVAAFNHQHIFIDPTPDAAKSWKERQRLFKLRQSSWLDYRGISKGGGVFDRSAKEIKCSTEIKTLFGISSSTISGEALIQVILTSSVDLIWFGGIGTYIKSSTESHIEVGDPANNNVRVNANDVKSTVISEGANLAITQKGRIEYELSGGKINTDAIDNSAGVNMSDYEVNIKILLSTLQTIGVIKNDTERNKVLEQATDEVTTHVLANNTVQHNLISMDQYRSIHQSFLIDHTISELIQLGRLNHIDEQIPTSKERQEFYKQNIPLPRPVLAKCQAYVKMRIKEALFASTHFSGPIYDDIFYRYFPNTIQSLVPLSEFPEHRLKKQIIITELTNYFVGLFGCATHETLSFSNQIPIDTSIHQLVILEEVFDIHAQRHHHWETSQQYIPVFELNRSMLHANLLCYLLRIPLDPAKISDYKRLLKHHRTEYLPISVSCLFFKYASNHQLLDNILKLDEVLGILQNIQLLESLSVSKHVMHTQKTSVLSDLFYSLESALLLPNATFNEVIRAKHPTLMAITTTNDVLPNLFLYSFQLRQYLNSIKEA